MKALLLLAVLTGADPTVVRSIAKQVGSFESLSGRFQQTKTIKGFQKPLVSEGSFSLTRGKGIVWHTTKPFESTLRISEQGIEEVKDDKATAPASSKSHPGSEAIGKLLLAVVAADVGALEQHFEFVAAESRGAQWSLTMRPRDANVARVARSIELRGSQWVDGVTLFEGNGDVTSVRFSDLTSKGAAEGGFAPR